ncbi:MAG TPA: hypothetical protein VKR53_07975 [Puia sp.]|nr:hypothetical protein [Puia sp.]
MKKTKRLVKFFLLWAAICSLPGFAPQSSDWLLEKMPVDLEKDFALSALPPHLRDQSTVYLLDPNKGYYVARKGTNGFSTLVIRTLWEKAEFSQDLYAAISFDPEGAKVYLPVFFDVAAMRGSGKYTPPQIKDIIVKRVKDGTYKAPARTGVSYMLSPLLRAYDGDSIVNQVIPHYMFYAPGVDNGDIGGEWDGHGPFAIGTGDALDKKNSIFNFIIIPAGDAEKARIVEANKDLLRRLAEYKPYLKINTETSPVTHHHH